MTCQRCGSPANDSLCRECRLVEHQEDYIGLPSDHVDEVEEVDPE